MDGFALLRMRVGDESSEIQCAPSRMIWDRTVDMMLQGHRVNNYDYGAWSVAPPVLLMVSYRRVGGRMCRRFVFRVSLSNGLGGPNY
jgi:hypothetical protein